MEKDFETTNVSDLWLKNILENVKNLENMERMAREGCSSLQEYIQMSNQNVMLMLPEVQYKNLKMMVSEMILLMTDVSPTIDKEFVKKINKEIEKPKKALLHRKLFIQESFNRVKKIITCKGLTTNFYTVLEDVCAIKNKIIQEIAPILFVEKFNKQGERKLK